MSIYSKWPTKQEIIEQIFNIFVDIINLERTNTAKYLEELLKFALHVYKQLHLPQCLDVVTVAVHFLGTAHDFHPVMTQISNSTFQIMQNDFNNEEIAESYFDLTCQIFKSCPKAVLGTTTEIIFQLGISCVSLDGASQTVMEFFERFVFDMIQIDHICVSNILTEHARPMVNAIIQTLATKVSCRPIIRSPLLFRLTYESSDFVHLIFETLNSLDRFKEPFEKDSLIKAWFSLGNNRRRFESLLSDFCRVCNYQHTSDVFGTYH